MVSQSRSSGGAEYTWRTFLAPMFAPGILYNTIKSGIAVEYPIYGGSAGGDGKPTWDASVPIVNSDGQAISGGAPIKLPFETLIEPTRFYVNERLYDSEPMTGSIMESTASFGGDTRLGPLYSMAMHNFLAESIDFFLDNGSMTSFESLPSGHPEFGAVSPDVTEYTIGIVTGKHQ